MSDRITRGVRVEVQSDYLPERSDPDQSYYFFVYYVRLINEGDEPVQLLRRQWIITDADGHTEQVSGLGVVGEQPLLDPGQSFEYTSFCPLRTTMGTMHGHYTMVTRDGEEFPAVIDPFTLATPHALN